MKIKIALVGLGKIAKDQHIPAIEQSNNWTLAATISGSSFVEGVDNFRTLPELLAARPDIPVISLCVPPAPRLNLALQVIAAGRHLMLEKPPGVTLFECELLYNKAQEQGVSVFATWHSRQTAAVDYACEWLADKSIKTFEIIWKEDVRRWHPGQEWIWQPGGLGVFDPGINAFSIATKIIPEAIGVVSADLSYPNNRQTPIAAELRLQTVSSAQGLAIFDWRQQGDQIWDIHVETDTGEMHLSAGGAELSIDGGRVAQTHAGDCSLYGEYPRLYRAMHRLLENSACDFDLAPMRLVADTFLLGRRTLVDSFEY